MQSIKHYWLQHAMRRNAGTLSEIHAKDEQHYQAERLILMIWNDLPQEFN